MPAAADLIARHHAMNALAMHSRGVDRGDAALLGAAYHPDATVDYGFFAGSAAQLVEMLAAAQAAAMPTLHRTGQCEIRVDGEQARAESYVIAYVEDPANQRLVFGRYLDRLELREGRWRIAHRTYVLDGNVNRPTTRVPPTPSVELAGFAPHGAKSPSDPAQALLAHHHAHRRTTGASPVTHAEAELDAALSREAIRRLLTSYCRGVDRGDRTLLASVFWDDAPVVSGLVNAPGPEFAVCIVDLVTSGLEYCFHSIANEWIEIDGDHGVGEHYVIAQACGGGQDTMTGGRYVDHYERREGTWKLAARTFVADWTTTHPKTLELDGMYEPLKTRGCFGPADPVYAHWASE